MSLRIEKLTRQHVLDGFDCGHESLNRFLLRFAWPNQQANASQIYVGLDDDAVIGFYTLVVGEVAYTLSRDWLSMIPRAGGEAMQLAGHRITVYRRQPGGRWLLARDVHTLFPA